LSQLLSCAPSDNGEGAPKTGEFAAKSAAVQNNASEGRAKLFMLINSYLRSIEKPSHRNTNSEFMARKRPQQLDSHDQLGTDIRICALLRQKYSSAERRPAASHSVVT